MAKDSVTVNISIADIAIQESNFATVMIFSPFQLDDHAILQDTVYFTDDGLVSGTPERIRYYDSIDDVEYDFKTTSAIYEKAAAAFSQNNVAQVAVGRRDTADADIAAALNAIKEASNNWYGIVSTYYDDVNITAIASWMASQSDKMYFAMSDDSTILTSSALDIASVLKALNNDRVAVLYHSDADTESLDSAALAYGLTFRAGTTTWEDKNLINISADTLTSTQFTLAEQKNCNVYVSDRGVNVFKGGFTANGRFIDTRVYADFLKEQIKREIRQLQIAKSNRGEKLSYTDKGGIAELRAAVARVLKRELDRGALTEFEKLVNNQYKTVPYIIKTKSVVDIPAVEKIARTYNYLDFEVRYSSAIHSVTINGILEV